MKTLSSGHHKVKRGWKLLAGLPKKSGRGSAVTPRRKPSPASPSNSACNRPQKPTLTRTGTDRISPLRSSEKFDLAPSHSAPQEDDPGRCESQLHPIGALPPLLPARVGADLGVEPHPGSLGL